MSVTSCLGDSGPINTQENPAFLYKTTLSQPKLGTRQRPQDVKEASAMLAISLFESWLVDKLVPSPFYSICPKKQMRVLTSSWFQWIPYLFTNDWCNVACKNSLTSYDRYLVDQMFTSSNTVVACFIVVFLWWKDGRRVSLNPTYPDGSHSFNIGRISFLWALEKYKITIGYYSAGDINQASQAMQKLVIMDIMDIVHAPHIGVLDEATQPQQLK